MEILPRTHDDERSKLIGELIESGDLLRAHVADVLDYAILMLDVDGHIVSWNKGAERFKGYRADEIVGRHFSVFYPAEDIAAGKPAYELKVATAEGRFEDEGWRLRKDGSRFWANVVITALRNKDGTLRGFGKITRDLTTRRAAELKLRESEERFRLMVEGVTDYAILMLDVDGHIATWNAGAERFKGYRADEILGQHFSTFYPAEDIAACKPERELTIAAAEGRFEDEGWRVRKDGSRFWANVVITALRDETGALRGYGKITRDLTERRAAEMALRTSEARFRGSFDQSHIGMTILDLAGRFERINDAFCRIVGRTRENLLGVRDEAITHPDDRAADAKGIHALLRGTAVCLTNDKRYLTSSGDVVWTATNLTLICDAEHRPLHFIAHVQDITERRTYQLQLEHMADHDPLTGLFNRRSFFRELESHAARIARVDACGSVLMIDLDHFKFYNDTLGHHAGDRLIAAVAQRLRAQLRACDVLARLGGDEFAILIHTGDESDAVTVAETVLAAVRTVTDGSPLRGGRQVTASIGIARFADEPRLTPEEIMADADLAMYDAKDAGRNRWSRYRVSDRAQRKAKNPIRWADLITRALEGDDFVLHAQPVVPLSGDRPPHYELLLRMKDAHGKLIMPGTFLTIAERLGLAGDIDRWVVDRAITTLAGARARGDDLRFEINLSGRSIADQSLADLVERRLAESGVPADRLIFEISEAAAVENLERAARFAERLSDLGCAFALDDFGAGLGSFYHLKHVPCDYVKIDGEFVKGCVTNETDRVLVAAVVAIARGLRKATIAEFVTNAATAGVLRELGVDFAQGYHFGRPIPLADVLASDARRAGSVTAPGLKVAPLRRVAAVRGIGRAGRP